MPKFIHPVAHQLFEAENRIKGLEKRNELLQREIQRLKELCKLDRAVSEKGCKNGPSKGNLQGLDPVPSYQRATIASRNRNFRAEEQMEKTTPKGFIVQGIPYTFRDGRLIGQGKIYCGDFRSGARTCFSYQKHTGSSKKKLKPLIRYIEPEPLKTRKSSRSSDSPEEILNIGQSEVSCSNESETLVATDSTESEGERNFDSLEDDSTLAGRQYIRIPTKTGYRILFRAFRLAQDIYYNAARKHWPTILERAFPGGPHEVQFGLAELERYSAKCHITRIPGTHGYGFTMDYIYDIIPLRNAICHFGKGASSWSMAKYDSYLQDVYRLATWVNDDARASKVEGLRTELWMEAKKVAEEIRSLEPLALLPLAHQNQWKPHHLAVFEHILSHRSTPDDLPPFLRCVVTHYEEVNPKKRIWEYVTPKAALDQEW